MVAFVAAIVGAVVWYGPVTHFNSGVGSLAQALEKQGLDVLSARAHGEGLLAAYLQGGDSQQPITPERYEQLVHSSYASNEPYIIPLPDAGLPQYALRNPPLQTHPIKWPAINNSLNLISVIVQELAYLLSAVGALLMLLRRKAPVITWQVGLLALVAVSWLAMIKLSGTLAIFYGWGRALFQALVVLAIPLSWSMQCLAEWRTKRQASILAIAAGSLTVIFIGSSGLADIAVGGGTLNGGVPLDLANSGEDFNRYYITVPELASSQWLGDAMQSGQSIYADSYARSLFSL